jgi:hypothetical protein
MGAADGALQQIAIGLAEGPENISFVSQMILPLFFQLKIKSPRRERLGTV